MDGYRTTRIAPRAGIAGVDEIGVPTQAGRIALARGFEPRERRSDAGRSRRAESGLVAIRRWHPHLAIALVTRDENASRSVLALAAELRHDGNDRWRPLPLAARDIPGPAFEERWRTIGAEARRLFSSGGRIVLYAPADDGRAGTVAARLLAELGIAPTEAIDAVRRARSSAFDTPMQILHVLRTRAILDAPEEMIRAAR